MDIPADLDWVLRIDGHTDRRPIFTAQFPSNWELSTARAGAVAKYLISRGLPADRMVIAGYAEFRPLDPADTDAAYNKNRRIEFKLDQR
jgi:chemotaxis protein MotB